MQHGWFLSASTGLTERSDSTGMHPGADPRDSGANHVTHPRIGVAVIAQNEADRIGRLLTSVAFADEVVVVDSGSTDATPAICRAMGARVIHHPWEGFAAQKEFALQAVQCDWILNLDADESVSEALAREMLSAVAGAPPEVAGFSMPRLSFYLNRWIRHGGWYPDRKVRLVRREKGIWSLDPLHEQLRVAGKTIPLSHPLHHHVYRDIGDQIATINRFSEVAAREKGPRRSGHLIAGLFHSGIKFLETYGWKRGFLDGWAGLVIAANSSWYVFLKHAKAWELSLESHATLREIPDETLEKP